MRVLSDEEVIATFGDPTPLIQPNGSVSPAWEAVLADVPLPAPLPLSFGPVVTHFRAHHLVAQRFADVFAALHADADVWGSINDFGGCYNFRTQRGSKKLSRHAWGIAVDIDVRDNPFLGMVSRIHPRAIRIFRDHGFAWGGATMWGGDFPWQRRDAQHFEFAGTVKED